MDHQELGQKLSLFMFSDLSPGSVFFLPHGMRIVEKLLTMLKHDYRVRDYQIVETPNIFRTALWKTSGHWEHYRDNMFHVYVDDKEVYSLKPMNCPSHCIIYKRSKKNYHDLPLRLADFGALHRNELSGSLTGLTRVRKFHQDDAHIFCRLDQVKEEILDCLEFLKTVYTRFGFDYTVTLSTRPSKFMGKKEQWQDAEKQLEEAIKEVGLDYTINDKDGAFYGPKIDVIIKDNRDRSHQCGTIQLDFQLPSESRFDLKYYDADSVPQTPVIVHRAIFGSVERMFAILLEHYNGKFPYWLSPRQVVVCSVKNDDAAINTYCADLHKELNEKEYWCDYDASSRTLSSKIKAAQELYFNYIVVIGAKEVADGTVTYRLNGKSSTVTRDQFFTELDANSKVI